MYASDTYPTARLEELCASFAIGSRDPEAPELRCAYCGRECDTYSAAHDDTPAAIREFVEHCAFDHSGPAEILEMVIARRIRITRES